MSLPIRSHTECSAPTQIFEVGATARVQTRTTRPVVFMADYEAPAAVPANSLSIDDFVSQWDLDPERRAALSAARGRLARKIAPEDDMSIKALRLRSGLSQASLAKAVGTSQPHIARLEGGMAEPTLETCRKLSRVLQVDLNTIGRAFPIQGEAT